MSPMKILVTGATGFVGRHLVRALLDNGCSVRAVARNAQTAARMPWINEVEFIAADVHAPLLDVAQLTHGVDALAHLAWPGLPNYQGLFHFEQNLFADYSFIKRAVEAGVKQVMVTGTCFEYGPQSGPLGEDTAPAPDNPYGLAKNTLRQFLEHLQVSQPFTLQWARLFYLYGEGQNPNSLLAALDRAIDAHEPHFNMSGGEQLRDYLPVEQAAGGLASLLRCREFRGVVNCCSGEPIAVRTLVERHVQSRNATIALNLGHYGYPAHEPMAFWGTTERLHSLKSRIEVGQ